MKSKMKTRLIITLITIVVITLVHSITAYASTVIYNAELNALEFDPYLEAPIGYAQRFDIDDDHSDFGQIAQRYFSPTKGRGFGVEAIKRNGNTTHHEHSIDNALWEKVRETNFDVTVSTGDGNAIRYFTDEWDVSKNKTKIYAQPAGATFNDNWTPFVDTGSLFGENIWMEIAQPATPIPITATAEGSQTPEVKDPPCAMVINGDFTITPDGFDPGHTEPLGDGADEGTSWRFDFAEDPEFQFFSTLLPLASAQLTLELTPKNLLIYNDIFRIDGLSPIPAFIGLPIGVLSTIQIELTNFYRNRDLLDLLKATHGSGGSSGIPAFYADDAIVSFAELTLTSFPGEKVNDRFPDLGPEDVDTDFDATPCAQNCIGTFTITAEFRNTSSDTLSDLFFEVGDLTGGNVLCNADGGVPWGYGADFTVPMDGVLKPQESFTVVFEIGLRSMNPFIFEVDLFGKVQK